MVTEIIALASSEDRGVAVASPASRSSRGWYRTTSRREQPSVDGRVLFVAE